MGGWYLKVLGWKGVKDKGLSLWVLYVCGSKKGEIWLTGFWFDRVGGREDGIGFNCVRKGEIRCRDIIGF